MRRLKDGRSSFPVLCRAPQRQWGGGRGLEENDISVPVESSPNSTDSFMASVDVKGEQQVCSLDDAEIHHKYRVGPWAADIRGVCGRVQATTHRLVWFERGFGPGDPKRSCACSLAAISRVKLSGGMLSTLRISQRIEICVRLGPSRRPQFQGSDRTVLLLTGAWSQLKTFQRRVATLAASAGDVARAVPKLPSVDHRKLEQLSAMGYRHERARAALVATGGDVSLAIQWLSDHEQMPADALMRLAMAEQQKQANPAAPEQANPSNVDADLINQLGAMGFPEARVRCALAATGSHIPSAIVEWLTAHPEASGNHDARLRAQYPPVATHTWGPLSHPVSPPYEYAPNVGGGHGSSITGPGWATEFTPACGSALQQTSPATTLPWYPALAQQDAAYPHNCGNDGAADSAPSGKGAWGGADHMRTSTVAMPSGPVGIEALVAGRRQKVAQIGADVHAGFKDLEAVRESGERLAQLAAELRSRTAAASGEGAHVDSNVAQQLMDLGIVSPVTRTSAGRDYDRQLSRQLASMLLQALPRAGGMMALHDAYCLFNRARGMELVSPDDLRSAAELFEELQLPLRLRVFPSGAAVVQDATWSDDAACARIVDALAVDDAMPDVDMAGLGRGLSVLQYALEAKMPAPVAREQLLLAERMGFVCRDDSAEGLFFYRNFFPELHV